MRSPQTAAVSSARIGRPPRAGVRSFRRIEFKVTPTEFEAIRQMASDNLQPVASIVRDAVNTVAAEYSERLIFVVPARTP